MSKTFSCFHHRDKNLNRPDPLSEFYSASKWRKDLIFPSHKIVNSRNFRSCLRKFLTKKRNVCLSFWKEKKFGRFFFFFFFLFLWRGFLSLRKVFLRAVRKSLEKSPFEWDSRSVFFSFSLYPFFQARQHSGKWHEPYGPYCNTLA